MEEQELLEKIIKQESWEDLITHIVTMENLDPWDIDLVKLADCFLKYIENIQMLDFRIPAKVVLVAAVLLKMKVEVAWPNIRKQPIEYSFEELRDNLTSYEEIKERLQQLTLQPGPIRIVKRKVTLDELIGELRKAVNVEKRREIRKIRLGGRLKKEINVDEEDIEKRINKLMMEIDFFLMELGSEKVEFSKLVKEWSRENIVSTFLPILYLATRGKVRTEQEEIFREIFIKKAQETNNL
ncbi:MAG: segregation/condensation protein A [Candidatus Aenigmatarchaeota archaeon]